ncbi:MAG: HTTM domain-containing protein [Ilumatobacteraceae bacterium]
MTTTEPPRVAAPESRVTRWRQQLAAPVDIASLVYFRIAFGAIMAWEMWRFVDHGWIDRYYTDKELYFSYWPFTFVEPLPEPWIHLVFFATMAAALLVVSGLFYRVAAPAMFVGLAYIFLLERARYLNHFYLIVLIAFLLCFLPLNRSSSVDAWRKPSLRSETVPAWCLWLIQFQIAVPYFFGGIAKLNGDWLRGEPLRDWLAARTDFPILGNHFTNEPVVWVMVYGALLLDLFVVAGLLYKKTRPWAFLAAVMFHLMNSRLFNIGVFPWTMIAATAIFFPASWPRDITRDLRTGGTGSSWRRTGLWVGLAVGFWLGGFLPDSFSLVRASIGAVGLGVGGYHVGAWFQPIDAPATAVTKGAKKTSKRAAAPAMVSMFVFVALAAWVAYQVLMPMRHLAIAGNVHWTEEGHDFSWHMKLRDKDADADFVVIADGEEFYLDDEEYLTDRQENKMEARPHLMVQYADFLEEEFQSFGYTEVEVYAEVWASLNGREEQLLIDPTFDLTTASIPWFGHAEWIYPLDPGVFELPPDAFGF